MCVIINSLQVFAADVGEVPCDEIIHKFSFGNLELTKKNENLDTVKIVGKDFLFSVPAADLANIELPRLQTVRIVTTSRKKLETIKQLGDDYLTVCLEFGEGKEVYLDPKNKNEDNFVKSKKVWNLVYFTFTIRGYSHRDRAVLVNDTDMKLLYKESGSSEVENGASSVLRYIDDPWNPPSLPVKN